MNRLHEKNTAGFCLVVLLAAFFVIGILGVLILPSFINRLNAHKSPQTEAKQYLASMNKAQQTYFATHNTFTNSREKLEIAFKPETIYYKYFMIVNQQGVLNYAITKGKFESFIGAVFVKSGMTESIICQGKSPGETNLGTPFLQNGVPTCSPDTELLK